MNKGYIILKRLHLIPVLTCMVTTCVASTVAYAPPRLSATAQMAANKTQKAVKTVNTRQHSKYAKTLASKKIESKSNTAKLPYASNKTKKQASLPDAAPYAITTASVSSRILPSMDMKVKPGDSLLLKAKNMVRVAVSSPDILDVVPASRSELLVNVKKEGASTVRIWDDNGLTTYSFLSGNDILMPEETARQITSQISMPNVTARLVGSSVLLSGTAETAEAAQRAVKIAEGCGRKIINGISVESISSQKIIASLKAALQDQNLTYEVLPDCTIMIRGSLPSLDDASRIQEVVEAWIGTPEQISSQTSLNSQINFVDREEIPPETADKTRARAFAEKDGNIVVGEEYNVLRSVFGGRIPNGPRIVAILQVNPALAKQVLVSAQVLEINRSRLKQLGVEWSNLVAGIATPIFTVIENQGNLVPIGEPGPFFRTPIEAKVRALVDQNAARVLSEPKLLIADNHPAHILVGGEFPIPVAQTGTIGANTVTVEFKQFGIMLTVRPKVSPDGQILLTLTPEVSNLDFTNAIRTSDFLIPAIKTRRSTSTVHMADGQCLAIGGLFAREDFRDIQKVPGLGSIPILGELFKSRRFTQNETELIILVTPRIVKNCCPSPIPMPGQNPGATPQEPILLPPSTWK